MSVISRRCLRICPVVVALCSCYETFKSREIVIARPGSSCKRFPVRIVQIKTLRRFGYRKDLDAAIAGEVSFLKIAVYISSTFFLCKIAAKINKFTHLIKGVGSVRIGRKNIWHRRSTDLSLRRSHDICLQIIYRTLAVAVNDDALFPSGGIVEFSHQLIE